jgi:hypothetical protein
MEKLTKPLPTLQALAKSLKESKEQLIELLKKQEISINGTKEKTGKY